MSSGVDPYAERPLEAGTMPSGNPPWARLVELNSGLVAAEPGSLDADQLSAARLVAVPDRGDGVIAPIARVGSVAATMLLALHGEDSGAGRAAELLELLEASRAPLYAVKHGWVAGPPGEPGCVEVDAELIGTVLAAELAGRLEWERDPDFGYEVPVPPPSLDGDRALALRPRLLYTAYGRVYEHAALVAALKRERAERLAGRDLPEPVLAAPGWPPAPTEGAWREDRG